MALGGSTRNGPWARAGSQALRTHALDQTSEARHRSRSQRLSGFARPDGFLEALLLCAFSISRVEAHLFEGRRVLRLAGNLPATRTGANTRSHCSPRSE